MIVKKSKGSGGAAAVAPLATSLKHEAAHSQET